MLIALSSCCEWKSHELLIEVITVQVMDNLFYLDYKYLSGSGMEYQGLLYVSFQTVRFSFATTFGCFDKRSPRFLFRDGNATAVEKEQCGILPVGRCIWGSLSFSENRIHRLDVSAVEKLDACRFLQAVTADTVFAARTALVSSR
jgi:hypothetical protein